MEKKNQISRIVLKLQLLLCSFICYDSPCHIIHRNSRLFSDFMMTIAILESFTNNDTKQPLPLSRAYLLDRK